PAPSFGRVLAPGSDRLAQLLLAMHPSAGQAYQAWATTPVTQPSPVEIHALRLTAPLFGHAAPKRQVLREGLVEWPIIEIDSSGNKIYHEDRAILYLDGSHPEVLPGSWIVVKTEKTPLTSAGELVARVLTANPDLSRADYGISGAVTRVDLSVPGAPDAGWILVKGKDISEPESGTSEYDESSTEELDDQDDFDAIRSTVVYAQDELLARAEEPISADVSGTTIELGRLHDGLEPGRPLIVTGLRAVDGI